MSQPKTYEAASIEEALRAATIDLGDDIEIIEAVKERSGGVLGFFARESFIVTARSRTAKAEHSPEQEFSELLLQLASDVSDTWDPGSGEPQVTQQHPSSPSTPSESLVDMAPLPSIDEIAPASHLDGRGVIDLRTGRRRPPPMVPLASAAGDHGVDRPERQSQLRRRLREGGADVTSQQYVMEVDGPMIDLRDSVPRWSLARLQMLGLPDAVLEVVERLDPNRDLEWVQSLSIAISKLDPLEGAALSYVVGHGRRSAVDLVLGIPQGRIPAAIIIDGQRVKVTPDELALSIRACIR